MMNQPSVSSETHRQDEIENGDLIVAAVESPFAKQIARFKAEKEGKIETHIYNAAERYMRRVGETKEFSVSTAEFKGVASFIDGEVEDFVARDVLEAWLPYQDAGVLKAVLHKETEKMIVEIIQEVRENF